MEAGLGPLASSISHVKQLLLDHKSDTVSPDSPSRDHYLELIQGIVGYFRKHQDQTGRILDPYAKKEIQYSTPCFAWASAVLIESGKGADLVQPAILALECSLQQLVDGNAAEKHGDFFTFPAVQAYELLRKVASAEQQAKLDLLLKSINPFKAYQSHLHNDPTTETEWTKKYSAAKMNNWNIVNVAGEFLRYQHNCGSIDYIEEHLAAQLPNFTEEGLYMDPHGPMAYDHFPRIFLASMLHRGYSGKHKAALETILERAAWASLMMQSPTGELPTGGRSAQHQWNEAQQCLTYEIFAIRKKNEGDEVAASAFKRAARLSLSALSKWVRPDGEFWIVKNKLDPSVRHGFEAYSFHSQYNLLAASMLATSWYIADETIQQIPAPCEIGGFIFRLPFHHRIFANCAGLYVQIDTGAESKYDSTGLVRIHKKGVDALVGPSDVSAIDEFPVAVGIGWQNKSGGWDFLAQFSGATVEELTVHEQNTKKISFTLVYSTGADSPRVREEYSLTPDEVRVKAQVIPKASKLKFRFPAFQSDGETEAMLQIEKNKITVMLFENAQTVQLFPTKEEETIQLKTVAENVPFRNGFLRVIEGETEGSEITYTLSPSSFSLTCGPDGCAF